MQPKPIDDRERELWERARTVFQGMAYPGSRPAWDGKPLDTVDLHSVLHIIPGIIREAFVAGASYHMSLSHPQRILALPDRAELENMAEELGRKTYELEQANNRLVAAGLDPVRPAQQHSTAHAAASAHATQYLTLLSDARCPSCPYGKSVIGCWSSCPEHAAQCQHGQMTPGQMTPGHFVQRGTPTPEQAAPPTGNPDIPPGTWLRQPTTAAAPSSPAVSNWAAGLTPGKIADADLAYAKVADDLRAVVNIAARKLREGVLPSMLAHEEAGKAMRTQREVIATLFGTMLVQLAIAANTAAGHVEPTLPPLDLDTGDQQ